MSKKNKQQNTKNGLQKLDNGKNSSKFQWFFFVIVIPFLFAIVIALVVMTIAGLNVFDLANQYRDKIPGVSSVIDKDVETEDSDESLFTLKATIEDQKAEITKLQNELENKQMEIDESKIKIENLNKELTLLQEKEKEITIKLEELAKVYEAMSSKNAASIFSEMDVEETLDIIGKMNNDSRAAILEKMEPTKAAELTVLLKGDENQPNTDNQTATN